MEKVLIIIRGLPNSGKSTFAKLLGRAICTADDWYTHKGVYLWDYRYIGEAHEWCERKCRRFMQKGIDRVIVANIHSTERSMRRYYELAEEFDYKLFTVIVEKRHNNDNNHNVPLETMENMAKKFQIKLS